MRFPFRPLLAGAALLAASLTDIKLMTNVTFVMKAGVVYQQ